MGAGWCKSYSKNCGADTSLQDMMTKWADRIGNGSEEPRWYKKWTRRRPNKWKDRPEISAPCLINPCFLEGTKWDNVILSMPDPEMKSRIPVAPPRRKRKRKPSGRDQFSGGLASPDDDQNPQVYQTISSPCKNPCLNSGSMNSMSLSSLSGPLTPSNRHRSFSCELQSRRMSLDSDYDCSLSSRTSLASIPVTNELYRKQHFLFSTSDHNFNMTQASTYSTTNSLSKKNQTQKRRRLLQNITKKYNLTLSLPSLNCIFNRHVYSKNVGFRYLDRYELCKFSSLPDLIHCSGDLSKEATVYATLYGIKHEPRYNLRHKTSTYGKGIKSLRRINSEDHRSFLKAGTFQNRQVSQLTLKRGVNNLNGTSNGMRTSISEDHEEHITANSVKIQDQEREPRYLRHDQAEKLKGVSESNFSQMYRSKIDFVRGSHSFIQAERANNTRNSNNLTESIDKNFISHTGNTQSELNDQKQNFPSDSKSRASEEYRSVQIDENNSSLDSISIAEQEINQSNTITLNKVEGNLCLSSINAARTERNSHTCCAESTNISQENTMNDDEGEKRSRDLETKERAEWLKLWSRNFDKSNKENLDGNLLSKHKNLSKFRTPKCLKTFRRLSQRQSFVDKVGCPLFFDKHHSCSCLRPRGQRFQSMSAISSEKYKKPNLKNGLIKKSLSVNHSQQGRKTDQGFKVSHCESANCCNNNLQKVNENNNNCESVFQTKWSPESNRVSELSFKTKETDVNSNITLASDQLESKAGLTNQVKFENSKVFEGNLNDQSHEVLQSRGRVNNFKNELTSGRGDTFIGPHRSVVKITDSSSDKSRRSSTSDSLCELENDIYDLLTESSINQQAAEVRD